MAYELNKQFSYNGGPSTNVGSAQRQKERWGDDKRRKKANEFENSLRFPIPNCLLAFYCLFKYDQISLKL